MKALVVYDSLYGNTEQVARAVAAAVTPPDTVKILRAGEAKAADMEGVEVLFVGSPTQGGRATKPIQEFLDKIPSGSLKNVRAAAFDTRIKTKLVRVFGYAAGRIEKAMKQKGGNPAKPGLFLVKSTKGPLDDGELERAAAWAREVLSPGK